MKRDTKDDLSVRKVRIGSYAVWQHGKHVGTVSMTGSHLDDYPWDWMLEGDTKPTVANGKYTGVAETKRDAINAIGYQLGNFYGRFGGER